MYPDIRLIPLDRLTYMPMLDWLLYCKYCQIQLVVLPKQTSCNSASGFICYQIDTKYPKSKQFPADPYNQNIFLYRYWSEQFGIIQELEPLTIMEIIKQWYICHVTLIGHPLNECCYFVLLFSLFVVGHWNDGGDDKWESHSHSSNICHVTLIGHPLNEYCYFVLLFSLFVVGHWNDGGDDKWESHSHSSESSVSSSGWRGGRKQKVSFQASQYLQRNVFNHPIRWARKEKWHSL